MDTNLKTKTVHYRDLGTVIVAQLHDIVFIYVYRQFDLVRSVDQISQSKSSFLLFSNSN